MRIRVWIRGFFGFSRRETNAFLVLLPLMVIVLFSEPVYRHWKLRQPLDLSKDQRYLDSLLSTLTFVKIDCVSNTPKFTKPNSIPSDVSFYSFDPNTLSEEKFIQLGLSPFLAGRIIRFREKGGLFRKKEDVAKIYGMDSLWLSKARDFITIPSIPAKPKSLYPTEKRIYATETFDINLADTIQLSKVYGIGPGLSKRIQAYRDRLGGFVSMNQLKEVWGLDSTVIKALERKFFIAEDFIPQQINLKSLKTEEIRHPYIKRKELYAIIAYSKQHGEITSLEQLKEIKILTNDWLEKVRPYLKME